MLLSSGLADAAYGRYGLVANEASTYLTWYRNVTKKYPHRSKTEVLADLVAHTPGEEGKWFAAAKSDKLFDEAIALVQRSPCSPQMLIRAARDFEDKNPTFAIESAVAALHWLTLGHGYDINSGHVIAACTYAMNAVERAGMTDKTRARIKKLVLLEPSSGDRFVSQVLVPYMRRGH